MGAYNALQQSDCTRTGSSTTRTNWIHPLYELPFTGGIPGTLRGTARSASCSVDRSRVRARRASRTIPVLYGDNPNAPRDPDRFDGDETTRSASSASASFRAASPTRSSSTSTSGSRRSSRASPFPQRLFDAYAAEVARVDPNGDGVDLRGRGRRRHARRTASPTTRGCSCPPTSFNRFAVTREINDGFLAPRFAPSQRAWVLSGVRVPVTPPCPLVGRDGDDR